MTQTEYDKLLEKNGQFKLDWMLDKLSNQKHSTGLRYKSDYHAVLSWVDKAFQSTSSQKNTINENLTLVKDNPYSKLFTEGRSYES